MDVREKVIEILENSFEKQYEKRGLLTAPHTASDLIANGVTVQEWIPVDDRLPKPFENVIVFRDGKISIDYNEGNGWFAYDFNGKRVTHWMPLPQPAK